MWQRISCLLLVLMMFGACQPDDDGFGRDRDGRGNGNNGGNGNNNNNNNLSALPLNATDPADNPSTPQKIELGKMLFWDPVLSGEQDVACATCHHPNRGYADGIDLSIGVGGVGLAENRTLGHTGFVSRNAPTIINTAFNGINQNGNVNPDNAEMFWDNRASGLEEQALMPLHSFTEMRGNAFPENQTLPTIVARLQNIDGYQTLFNQAFGSNSISAENVAKALAAFERSILANNSPFDQYMRGNDNALTQQQLRGMNEFVDVGCNNCHNGPMFSDYELHVLGVRENNKLDEPDEGDGDFAFRTPTLRNLAFTAPYMHNGEFNTLERVLDFYDDNHDEAQNNNVNDNDLDDDLQDLDNLNRDEMDDIIAFLESLNDPTFDRSIPSSVPSGLPPGGRIE